MMLLIVVDAHSKWIEVKATNSTTTAATIAILHELFAAYGAPVTVVSDNGTQFTASEFGEFLRRSGVKYHKRTAPYHSSTNCQAERCVQTVKDALKAMSTTGKSLQRNINTFLQQYRKAPHTTTGQSPALLFLGRNPRTRIDLVRPDDTRAGMSQRRQTESTLMFREFGSPQPVYFLSGNHHMDKWIPGIINRRLGDLHYQIEFRGKLFKRHVDQIRSRRDNPSAPPVQTDCERPRRIRSYANCQTPPPSNDSSLTGNTTPGLITPLQDRSATPIPGTPVPQAASTPILPRRSERTRQPPSRYSPS